MWLINQWLNWDWSRWFVQLGEHFLCICFPSLILQRNFFNPYVLNMYLDVFIQRPQCLYSTFLYLNICYFKFLFYLIYFNSFCFYFLSCPLFQCTSLYYFSMFFYLLIFEALWIAIVNELYVINKLALARHTFNVPLLRFVFTACPHSTQKYSSMEEVFCGRRDKTSAKHFFYCYYYTNYL